MFDLTSLRAVDRGWKRVTFFVRLGVASGLTLVGAFLLAVVAERALRENIASYRTGLPVVAFFWLLALFALLDLPGWLPGATAFALVWSGPAEGRSA